MGADPRVCAASRSGPARVPPHRPRTRPTRGRRLPLQPGPAAGVAPGKPGCRVSAPQNQRFRMQLIIYCPFWAAEGGSRPSHRRSRHTAEEKRSRRVTGGKIPARRSGEQPEVWRPRGRLARGRGPVPRRGAVGCALRLSGEFRARVRAQLSESSRRLPALGKLATTVPVVH